MALTQNDAQMIADAVMRGIRQAGGFGSDRSGDTSFTRDTSRKSRPRNTDVDAASDEMIKSLENLSSSYDSVTLRWKRSLNNSANWVIGSGLKKAQKEYVDSLDAISDASKGRAKDIIKSFSDFVKNNSKNFDEQQKLLNKFGDYNKIANKLKKELKSADKTEESVKKLRDELNGVAGDLRKYGVSVDDITQKVKANGQISINNSNVLKGMLDANQKLHREARQHVDRTKELHREEIDARMRIIKGLGSAALGTAKRYADSIESRLSNLQSNRRLGTVASGYGVGEGTIYEFLRSNVNVGATLGGSDRLLDALDDSRRALNEAGFFKEGTFEGLGKFMSMELSAGILHSQKSTQSLIDIMQKNMAFSGMSRDESMAWLAEEMRDNQTFQIASIGKNDDEQLEILEEMLVASRITARQSGLSANFLKNQEQHAANMRHANIIDIFQKGIMTTITLDQYASMLEQETGQKLSAEQLNYLKRGHGPEGDIVSKEAGWMELEAQRRKFMMERSLSSGARAFMGDGLDGGMVVYDALRDRSALSSKAYDISEGLSIAVTSEAARLAEERKAIIPEYQKLIQDSRESYNIFDNAVKRFEEAVGSLTKSVFGPLAMGAGGAVGLLGLRKFGPRILDWGRGKLGRGGPSPTGGTPASTVPKGGIMKGLGMSMIYGYIAEHLISGTIDTAKTTKRGYDQGGLWGGILGANRGLIESRLTPNLGFNDMLLDRIAAEEIALKERIVERTTGNLRNKDPTQSKIEENTEETKEYLKKIYESSAVLAPISGGLQNKLILDPINPSIDTPIAPQPISGGNALLDLIASKESGAAGYNAWWLGSKVEPSKSMSEMTIGEVKAWQRETLNEQKSRGIPANRRSSAAGRYQFISGTLAEMQGLTELSDDDLFDAANQDKLALALLNQSKTKGLSAFLEGRATVDDLQDYVASKWASIKDSKGIGQYDAAGFNKSVDISRDFAAVANSLLESNAPASPMSWWSGFGNSLKAITSGRSLDEDGNLVDISDNTPGLFGTLIDTVAQVRDKVQENTTNREDVNNENRNFSQYATKIKQSAQRRADAHREEFSNSIGAIHSAYANIDNTL